MRIENSTHSSNGSSATLSEVSCGACVRIKAITGDADVCKRLREMGMCEHEFVRKVSDHGALICEVGNNRLAFSESIAQNIFVEEVAA